MSNPNSPQDPTADYRKYPKGPNFLLIVILASVAILIILAIGVFVVGGDGRKLIPHGPNPTPNSMLAPPALTPGNPGASA
jgi:hypothetical protein